MVKRSLALLIAFLPGNVCRLALLKWLLRYEISWDSRVGWGTVLQADRVRLQGARIGPLNLIQCADFEMEAGSRLGRMNGIRMLHSFRVGPRAEIVNRNRFFGTRRGISPFKAHERVEIGADSIITSQHSFDVSDGIAIGSDVTFGGSGSQVWTHGFDLDHVKIQAPVVIGNRVYLGSRCLILGGVSICDNVSVGAGAVVSSPIRESGFYVSSRLERKGDVPSFAADPRVIDHCGARFVRK